MSQALQSSVRHNFRKSVVLAAIALAMTLSVHGGSIQAESQKATTPPEARLVSLANPPQAAPQASKLSHQQKGWAENLGFPAWVVGAGGLVWSLFLLGEPIQKNLKAWRVRLGLLRETNPSTPTTTSGSAGIGTLQVNDSKKTNLLNVSSEGVVTVSAGGTFVLGDTVGGDKVECGQITAQTVNQAQTINFHSSPVEKPERIRSTIEPSPQVVGVVGREEELDDLDIRMGEPGNNRRLMVHGESGVGKSELLREYARRHTARYPGGRYWIDCRLNLAHEITTIGREYLRMGELEGSLEHQAIVVLKQLAKEEVLLIYDNTSDEEQVRRFLPQSGQAHVLLSSTSKEWGPPLVEVWREDGLRRLDPEESMDLLRAVAGEQVADQVGAQVIREIGGLPVHLLPTARALARQARLGRLSEAQLVHLSEDAVSSFSITWENLDPPARLLLQAAAYWFNPSYLFEAELIAVLAKNFSGEDVVRNAIDTCRDLYLLQGKARLSMHQLLTQFVATQPPEMLEGISAEHLAKPVVAALLQATRRFVDLPGQWEAIACFQCYQLRWEFWRLHLNDLTETVCHGVGIALIQLGQYSEARNWLRASEHLIKCNAQVDHAELGAILHAIGCCTSREGNFETAVALYKQAIAERRQGDLLGRVDCDGIGKSLKEIGGCFIDLGDLEASVTWLKQAYSEASQGDRNGRVDHHCLGAILHDMGLSLFRQSHYSEAGKKFEQAANEKSQGGLDGKVNHQSLGSSLHELGTCFFRQKDWNQAQLFYQKAVDEMRQGDEHGQLDSRWIGIALHQLGNCAFEKGELDDATQFYLQAIDEERKGDHFGRVDQDDQQSIAKSLHKLADCAAFSGRWNEAEQLYEQVIATKRQGDNRGCVDHDTLGRCLHQLGNCNFQKGVFREAQNLYEQAISEVRQGDMQGQVNHECIGLSLYQLALCACKQEDWNAAISLLQKAEDEARQGDKSGRVNQRTILMFQATAAEWQKKREREK